MIILGVTGNLASGKSEATQLFRKFGALVFDADKAARKVVQKGKPAYWAIVKMFGEKYLRKDKQIDRKKLAERVFSHPSELRKLNILTHPGVIFECLDLISKKKKKQGVLVLDVPLLFESNMQNLADYTVVVKASRQKMIARAAQIGMSKGLAKRILSTQWPMARKVKHADFVIDNNGSRKLLEKQVLFVLSKVQTSPRG